MITFLKKWFQGEERFVHNELMHLAISFESACQAIRDAEEEFNRVRATKVSDFNALKGATVERTRGTIASFAKKTDEEETRVNDKHAVAVAKISQKRNAAQRLQSAVDNLSVGFNPTAPISSTGSTGSTGSNGSTETK